MIKKSRISIALFAVVQLLCSAVIAEPLVSPEQIADTQIRQALSNGASSATVAIMDDGGIVYAQAFGMRDKTRSIPVDTKTQFTIGSTSKIFAAAAILMLCQDKRIELNKPVTDYLPDFKMTDPRYKNITVRMLLNHTSGMPGTNYKDAETSQKNRKYIKETRELLEDCSLKSDPGDISVYCNDGFTLAEEIVAKVSGMSYSEFLEERIFSKAGMKNTSCYFKEGNENIARQYESDTGSDSYPTDYVNVLGSGGVASTAIDLCRFANVMWSGKLLNATYLAEYETEQYGPYTALSGKPCNKFGLGWDSVSEDKFASHGITVLSKDGDTSQFHSRILTAPEEKLTVAIIACGPANVVEIGSNIMQALLEEKGYLQSKSDKPSPSVTDAVIPDEMMKFAGVYMYHDGGAAFKVVFDKKNNTVSFFSLKNGKFIDPGVNAGIHLKSDGYFHNPAYVFKFVENDKGKYKAKCLVSYPNTSSDGSNLMQMIEPLKNPFPTKKFEDKFWLSVNLSYYDLVPLPVVQSFAVEGMPGYIAVNNDICALTGAATGTSGLPYLRDTKEVSVIDKKGKSYLTVLNYQYSDNKDIGTMEAVETVTIGKDGDNEWRVAGKDFTLDYPMMEKSRILVVSADGETLYDSLMNGLKPFEVKKGNFVGFIGESGAIFALRR